VHACLHLDYEWPPILLKAANISSYICCTSLTIFSWGEWFTFGSNRINR
jgi:hypothetical protein